MSAQYWCSKCGNPLDTGFHCPVCSNYSILDFEPKQTISYTNKPSDQIIIDLLNEIKELLIDVKRKVW